MKLLRNMFAGLVVLALAVPLAADDGHQNWINLLSVSQSMTKPMGAGATRPSGARVQVDRDFIRAVEAGRHSRGTVVLTVEKSSPAARALKAFRAGSLELETPSGKSFWLIGARAGGSSQGRVPTENITLNYELIRWTY